MGCTQVAVAATVGLVLAMLWGGAQAQSGCTTALMSLAPCLNFISGGSTSPSSSCCSQLSSVVQTQAQCLCQVVNGNVSSFGVTINQTQALALPGACKVQTPPATQCNAVDQQSEGPAASPVGSPSTSPADASAVPDTPTTTSPTVSAVPSTGTGSKTTSVSKSDGNMNRFSIHLTLFLIFITSSAFFFTRI